MGYFRGLTAQWQRDEPTVKTARVKGIEQISSGKSNLHVTVLHLVRSQEQKVIQETQILPVWTAPHRSILHGPAHPDGYV